MGQANSEVSISSKIKQNRQDKEKSEMVLKRELSAHNFQNLHGMQLKKAFWKNGIN